MGPGCVKTPARFHTNLFRSLFRDLRALRIGKIAKNFALLDRLQNFVEFSHRLGRDRSEARRPVVDAARPYVQLLDRGLWRSP
jgi:hypothetical protein